MWTRDNTPKHRWHERSGMLERLMTRAEHTIRNRLALAVGMTLIGIIFGLYGFDVVGAISAVAGMFLLVLNVHRLGRIGEDL